MKKMIGKIFAVVGVVGIGVCMSMVAAKNKSEGELLMNINEIEDSDGVTSMLALADSEDEAKKIAELYGITFVDFSYGVATYETTKNPRELMEFGEKNNYPPISVNGKNYLD